MNRRMDNDTEQYGVAGPYKPWESDSTGFVHILWAARRAGLTLEKDADEIATMVMGSRWLQAVKAHAPSSVSERNTTT